jgi:iron complex transport system substrate-binding protein
MSTGAPTVVSTSPSGTEICCALGVEPAVISGSCDHPPSITDRPRLDRSRVDGATSAERDEQATSSETVYDLDDGLLREVAPDLVLTQRVCGVCAVDEGRIRQHLRDVGHEPDVLGLQASTLDSVLDCVREVGDALDRADRAADLIEQLRASFDATERYTATAEGRPRVVVFEWLDPLHVAANWVPEIVQRAGGTYPLADPGDRSVEVEWDRVRAAEPDVIVVAPCSYSVEDARAEIDALTDRPGWEDRPAVGNDRVYAVDGGALNRWKPRLAGECERLATVCHPDLFDGEPLAEPL